MDKKWIGIGLGAVVVAGVVWMAAKERREPQKQQGTKAEIPQRTIHTKNTKHTKSVDSISVPKTKKLERLPATSLEELKVDAADAMDRKAYDKARVALESVMAQTVDLDDKLVVGQDLYECLVRTHDYDAALALGQELLSLNPTPEERLLFTQQLAALLQRMGRSDEAEKLLGDAIASADDAETKEKLEGQLRSVWRHTDGRMDEVVAGLERTLETDPNDEQALKELGAIYLKSRRDYESAKPVYEKLAELQPEDQQVQSALLKVYRETDDFDGMRRVYEQQIELSEDDDANLRFQVAATELYAGRGDDAVTYAEEYLGGDDATPHQLQMLSKVYDRSGRKEEAVRALDQAIDQSNDLQQRTSIQFQKADMLFWNKQYAEAEAILRKIKQENADNQQVLSRVNNDLLRLIQAQGKMGEIKL